MQDLDLAEPDKAVGDSAIEVETLTMVLHLKFYGDMLD